MRNPAKKPATYADIEALPAGMNGEIVAGELWASPRPTSRHAVAASYLGGQIIGPGGWWLLFEPELHLGEDVMVPDLAGWRRERMPVVEDVAAFKLAPDWICEVVSRGTARLDRMLKLPRYARAGVGHAWLVDPPTRTLEAFRRQGESWLLVTSVVGDEKAPIEPFDAVELNLATLWIPEPPGTPG
jgi:Uma2 family endonuclease